MIFTDRTWASPTYTPDQFQLEFSRLALSAPTNDASLEFTTPAQANSAAIVFGEMASGANNPITAHMKDNAGNAHVLTGEPARQVLMRIIQAATEQDQTDIDPLVLVVSERVRMLARALCASAEEHLEQYVSDAIVLHLPQPAPEEPSGQLIAV